MNDDVLEDRGVLVTGADSGIGYAVASSYVEQGEIVYATDLTEGDGMRDLASQGAITITGDLTQQEFRAHLVEESDGIGALVNSAGIIGIRPIVSLTESDWDRIFSINAKALFFLTQSIAEKLPDYGSIVNLSSVSARRADNTESAIYAASKAAVLSITRSFAHALSPRNIRVNSILPGLIDTPMQTQVVTDTAQARQADHLGLGETRVNDVPLGRLGAPLEIADIVLWLTSNASTYITGQAIAADGGLTMA